MNNDVFWYKNYLFKSSSFFFAATLLFKSEQKWNNLKPVTLHDKEKPEPTNHQRWRGHCYLTCPSRYLSSTPASRMDETMHANSLHPPPHQDGKAREETRLDLESLGRWPSTPDSDNTGDGVHSKWASLSLSLSLSFFLSHFLYQFWGEG